MREIGRVSDRRKAETFQDYLLTLGVKATVDEEADGCTVWVYDEDHVERAKTELDKFVDDSDADVYRQAASKAEALRDEEIRRNKQARKNQVNVRDRWNRPLAQACPVTYGLIMLSVVVAVVSSTFESLWQLCDRPEPLLKYLFTAPVIDVPGGHVPYEAEAFQSIRQGQVWRLVTPILIHFSLLHIFFNMWWLRDLGAAIEYHCGSGRFALLVLTIAVASNAAQYVMRGPNFGGMSGVVFGLFGYIWIKSRTQPESGFFLHPSTVFWVMVWFFLCMTGRVGAIANWAHGVGLVVGLIIGYAPVFWRKASK